MKNIQIIAICFSILSVSSCSVNKKTEQAGQQIAFLILAGINHGGITENTDLSLILNTDNILDAYSGATKITYHTGIHIVKGLKRNQIESGVDYMLNHQTFTYKDEENKYNGTRELYVRQIMLPLTYNFNIFNKLLPDSKVQLKIGYIAQLNFINIDDRGNLPQYTLKKWSNGLTLGVSSSIIRFKNGNDIGFYLDIYRGSRIYEDFYNRPAFEMPGTSFARLGLRYQF